MQVGDLVLLNGRVGGTDNHDYTYTSKRGRGGASSPDLCIVPASTYQAWQGVVQLHLGRQLHPDFDHRMLQQACSCVPPGAGEGGGGRAGGVSLPADWYGQVVGTAVPPKVMFSAQHAGEFIAQMQPRLGDLDAVLSKQDPSAAVHLLLSCLSHAAACSMPWVDGCNGAKQAGRLSPWNAQHMCSGTRLN
jgi:hypothetical protein